MTIKEKAIQVLAKYKKNHIIKSEPEDYIHEGLDGSQFFSHLQSDVLNLIDEAENINLTSK